MPEDLQQALLNVLLDRTGRNECKSLSQWLPIWTAAHLDHGQHGPYVAAVAASMRADRMAWAFFCGNQGAVQAAFPDPRVGRAPALAAFCANETARKLTDIETTLHTSDHAMRLQGHKSWCLADAGELTLYVLARRAGGPVRGPGSLVIVRIARDEPGVQMGEARAQSVVPELRHCEVTLAEVAVSNSQLIPGDGYADHARPFRLREDVFVTGCTLAFLLAEAHAGDWSTRWRQRCLATIMTLGTCASMEPSDTSTQLLTAGTLAWAGDLIEQADSLWSPQDSAAAARWMRD